MSNDALATILDHRPANPKLFERALTHGSHGGDTYERLEFLGDRVLGLIIADWLYERFPAEPEGQMSRRYNVLVARETCAAVGHAAGIARHIRLGKQARADHSGLTDNVVGDVVEALLGALYLDGGMAVAQRFVRAHWGGFLDGQQRAPMHPKSGLQELAAARNLGVPVYELVGRFGVHHAPRFKVKVSLGRHGEAEAEGASKQEAETLAALALLESLAK